MHICERSPLSRACFVPLWVKFLSRLKVISRVHLVSLSILQWRHNECDGISDHQPHDCLLKRLFRRRSKKISKLCVTGLCAGNSPVTGEFPTKSDSNAENVSIWRHHHDLCEKKSCSMNRGDLIDTTIRHDMQTLSALLTLWGNVAVTSGFPSQMTSNG